MTQMPSNPLAQATVLYQAGRFAEAETEARSMAAALERAGDDPFIPLLMSIVGLAVGAQGRHTEAVATYDAQLPLFGRTFGVEHPLTLKLRADRAQALNMLGRHAECEAECAALIETAARNASPEMAGVAMAAVYGRVQALNALGRYPEAEALARELLATLPDPDRFTLLLRLGLAVSLNAQKRHEEALTEARHADEVHRGLPPEQRGSETGAAELAAATALLGLGRGTEARPEAAAAHDACLALFGPDNIRTTEARNLLARIDGA
ncbi:tetratricopeptide repeat protein [Streptomyces sp. NPDC089799]|uniref:tetratricopeptide repeat protein n=1 Tax=Streptomyces sp. NPDC089799 TaxID=3155066 RepID=UPI0034285361